RERQGPADATGAADPLLLVQVEHLAAVERGESEQRRRVVKPRLGEAQEVVLALAAALEVEVQRLAVAEHVRVAELEEPGQAAVARVSGARRSRPDLLLLHLELDVHV